MLHRLVHFTLSRLAFNVLALILFFLSFADSELNLRQPFFEVHSGRDEGHSFLGGLTEESFDLLMMKEEFSLSERLMIPDVAVSVGGNMSIIKPGLKGFTFWTNLDIGVTEVGRLLSDALDFCTGKDHPALHYLTNEVVLMSIWVRGDQLFRVTLVLAHDGNFSEDWAIPSERIVLNASSTFIPLSLISDS